MTRTAVLPKPPTRRHFRAALWVPFVAVVGAFVLPLPRDGSIAGLPSPCPFYVLSGWPCPGCGLTRSFVSFAHGEFGAAFAYHPLGPLLFCAAVFMLLWQLLALSPRVRVALSRRAWNGVGIATVGLLLLAWGVRLAGWWPLPS